MSKLDKRIEKICAGGQVSIEEVKALMTGQGFTVRQSGSHVTISKGADRITIPASSQVKKCYLTQLCEILRGLGL